GEPLAVGFLDAPVGLLVAQLDAARHVRRDRGGAALGGAARRLGDGVARDGAARGEQRLELPACAGDRLRWDRGPHQSPSMLRSARPSSSLTCPRLETSSLSIVLL